MKSLLSQQRTAGIRLLTGISENVLHMTSRITAQPTKQTVQSKRETKQSECKFDHIDQLGNR